MPGKPPGPLCPSLAFRENQFRLCPESQEEWKGRELGLGTRLMSNGKAAALGGWWENSEAEEMGEGE